MAVRDGLENFLAEPLPEFHNTFLMTRWTEMPSLTRKCQKILMPAVVTPDTCKAIMDYAANFQTLSDDVAKDLVDRSIGIQKDAVKLMESYLPKFSKAVGDKKTARFYQIENKIDAIVNFELAANIPLAQ